jgi:hypothetical protein
MAPGSDGVGLDHPASAALDRLERGPQREPGHALPAVRSLDDETRYPPKLLGDLGVDRWCAAEWSSELVAGPELTPPDGLAVGVDENAVCAAILDERLLVLMIDDTDFRPGAELPPGRARVALKTHAPAVVPTVPARKEPLEIRPRR